MSSLYGNDSCAKPEDTRARIHTQTNTQAHIHAHTHTHTHTHTSACVHLLCIPQIQNLVSATAGCGMSHKNSKTQNIQYEVLHVFHIQYSKPIPNTLYMADNNLMDN